MIAEQRHNMKEYEPRPDGISNTISTVQKDNYLIEPKIHKLCNLRAGASGMKDPSVGRVYGTDGIAPSILSRDYKDPKLVALLDNNYRIRKLTPKECFRLMGVSDTDISKIQKSGVSKTQQYKLAGNSIVVDVMAYIFGKLFKNRLQTEMNHPKINNEPKESDEVRVLGYYNKSHYNSSRIIDPTGITPVVMGNHGTVMAVPQKVGNIYPSGGQNGNVYSVRGINSTIASGTGIKGNGVGSCNAPKIIAPLKNFDSSSVIWRGVEMHEGEGFYLFNSHQLGGLKGISRTLKASKDDMATVQHGRIRKLTARESFRVMGMSENEIDRLQSSGISSAQQKKLAGNSIVVDVMACIFKNLLLKKEGA